MEIGYLTAGDALSAKVDRQRNEFDAWALGWQAEKLGLSEAEILAMSVRGELLSKANELGLTDFLLTTQQAYELATTYDQAWSRDYPVDGVLRPYGYYSELRRIVPWNGQSVSLYYGLLHEPRKQIFPDYDLLFGQHLGKIPYYNIISGFFGDASMRIYYPGDTDPKIGLFAPDGTFADAFQVSYSRHNTSTEIARERQIDWSNVNAPTVPKGLPMEQSMLFSSTDYTRYLKVTKELFEEILKQKYYIFGASVDGGIQDGLAVYDRIFIDAKLFETLKSDPRFSALFVQQ